MTDTTLPTSAFATFEPLAPEDYDALDLILDDLRSRSDETPQWEFCEGFLAALVCCLTAAAKTNWDRDRWRF
jgi:uncharacterized protein